MMYLLKSCRNAFSTITKLTNYVSLYHQLKADFNAYHDKATNELNDYLARAHAEMNSYREKQIQKFANRLRIELE